MYTNKITNIHTYKYVHIIICYKFPVAVIYTNKQTDAHTNMYAHKGRCYTLSMS